MKSADQRRLLSALFRGELTEAQAARLAELGPEAVRLVLLAASEKIEQLQLRPQPQSPSPSTPPGMVPVYEKPPELQKAC